MGSAPLCLGELEPGLEHMSSCLCAEDVSRFLQWGCPHKQEALGSPEAQPGCLCLPLLNSESQSLALIVAGGCVEGKVFHC